MTQQGDADGVSSVIVGKESPELQGKKTDTPVLLVFLLFLVPLALSIQIDAFLVQSKYIQLLKYL